MKIKSLRTVAAEVPVKPKPQLPPEVKPLWEDWVKSGGLKRALNDAVKAIPELMRVLKEGKTKGFFVALAEVEDREQRMAIARTLQEVQAGQKRNKF